MSRKFLFFQKKTLWVNRHWFVIAVKEQKCELVGEHLPEKMGSVASTTKNHGGHIGIS